MFNGNIYNVMIGAPSDIKEEIEIVKSSLYKWNEINSETQKIVLLPLHWSTNTYPESGGYPQKLIDNQMVDKSDLLICIFGTRLGSPTDTHQSGTIEEIDEHIKNGRNVMLFFKLSSSNIADIDITQLQKLNDFKEKIKNDCIYYDFKDDIGGKTKYPRSVTFGFVG